MNSEAVVSKMPGTRLASPKVATCQPATSTERNFLKDAQWIGELQNILLLTWDLPLFCFASLLVIIFFQGNKKRKKMYGHGNNFLSKVVICLVVWLKCLQNFMTLSLMGVGGGQTFGKLLILFILLGKFKQQKLMP